MPYHRIESPTQTSADAKLQESSHEIWGRAASSSSLPSVKAYRNSLPNNVRGIEFDTAVTPTRGSGTPFEARWYANTSGVRSVNHYGVDFAVITATVTKNTQVP
jgi:hypothetical protein